jgi:hypothetical protein
MAHVRLLGFTAPAAVVDVVDGVGNDVVVVALFASEPGVITSP